MSYGDAMLRYGSDKPDVRFGLEIQDATDVTRGSEFGVFAGAETVRYIVVPETFSRGELQKLEDFAKEWGDRKSTRLNSSHLVISYAVFCLKKKNKKSALAGSTHDNRSQPPVRLSADSPLSACVSPLQSLTYPLSSTSQYPRRARCRHCALP